MHSAPTTVRNRRYGSGRPHFRRLLHAEWLRISSLNHDVKPLGPLFVQKSGRFARRCMQCGEIPKSPTMSREAHDFTRLRRVDPVYLLIGRSRRSIAVSAKKEPGAADRPSRAFMTKGRTAPAAPACRELEAVL